MSRCGKGIRGVHMRSLGHSERAVRLFAWADSVRRAIGDPRSPVEQADVDRDFALIRSQLDEVTIDAARAVGRDRRGAAGE
jgi:hypothetical protein